MIDRFVQFSSSISNIYKYIQKIERYEMAKFGLKSPHVECLVSLHRSQTGLTAAQLCHICSKDKAAISRAVSQLVEKGLIAREGSGDNMYRAVLTLTEQGERVADEISEIAEAAVGVGGKGLTEDSRETFYSSLFLIEDNLKKLTCGGSIDLDLSDEA